MMTSPSYLKLTGRTDEGLVLIDEGQHRLQKETFKAYLSLKKNAKKAGIHLAVASSFRNYERQLLIWNEKAKGLRPLLDQNERPVSYSKLSNIELVHTIMHWSALPGASRHHWGTDFDVFDLNALPGPDYKIELTIKESQTLFKKLHHWLDEQIEEGKSFGLYRPYTNQYPQGLKVAKEPWHLSFAPASALFLEKYTLEVFIQNLEQSQIELKETLLDHALELYADYMAE